MRKNLVAWQWADYPQKHRNPVNLRLHMVAIPMFWLGTATLIASVVEAEIFCALSGAALCLSSMIIQGAGHKRESEAPTPFDGPIDFITRFLTEQFFTYPRFVIFRKRQSP